MAEKCPKIIKDMAERSTKILSRTEIKNSLLINSKCQKKHAQSHTPGLTISSDKSSKDG